MVGVRKSAFDGAEKGFGGKRGVERLDAARSMADAKSERV